MTAYIRENEKECATHKVFMLPEFGPHERGSMFGRSFIFTDFAGKVGGEVFSAQGVVTSLSLFLYIEHDCFL